MTGDATHRAIEAVVRIESARLIAGLARVVRDVGRAEELAQDAFLIALERWPVDGIPQNLGAWLMQTAKRRAVNAVRHARLAEAKHVELGRAADADAARATGAIEDAIDDDVGDDLLRLVFTACHPVLSREARVALTLRLLGGLTTDEIARALLATEPTIAQRIVRAKRMLADANVAFEVPRGAELEARLSSVLEVVYLVFNEGYAATAGADWMRTDLCDDALRLARILQGLMPDEAEVHGLAALLEIQASRAEALASAPASEPVLLLEQNRARWDRVLVRRGLAALERAEAIGGVLGPYVLQAAIAACHARANAASETDWARIAALYARAVRRPIASPSPSSIQEPAAPIAASATRRRARPRGLAVVDAIAGEKALKAYHLLPSVRGDLLAKLGRVAEAKAELERAAAMTKNERERSLLLARAAALA